MVLPSQSLRAAIVQRSPALSKLGASLESEVGRADRLYLSPEGELYFKGSRVPLSLLDIYDLVHLDGAPDNDFKRAFDIPYGFKPEKSIRESEQLMNMLRDNRFSSLSQVNTPRRVAYTQSATPEKDFEAIRESLRYPFVRRPVTAGLSTSTPIRDDEDLRRLLYELPEEEHIFEEHLPGMTAWVLVLPGLRGESMYTAVPIGRLATGVYGPIHLNEPLKTELLETAIDTASELGIKKLALLAFRLSHDGRILFLKGNPLPDILEEEQFEASLKSVDIGYPELARHLVSRVKA
jgi:hypothetical protein